jgi:hypothetical protein
MPTSTKENVLIFMALLITYFGVYLLAQSGSVGAQTTDARWAGFFSVTLGIFSLLTLLFGHTDSGAVPAGTSGGRWGNVYLITAGVALAASAFFNFKLFRSLPKGTLKYVVMANIAAHVVLLLSYFMNFGAAEQRLNAARGGLGLGTAPTPVYTPLVAPVTPGLGMISPRLPVRAR